LAYRNDIITRGHETNNYAEATVRLLKDIMLERRKAFNVVALVGYIITVLEPYYEKRLYEVASGRPSPLLAAFSRLQTTANTVNLNGSVQLEADTYQVTSSSGQNVYIVNIREGVCTCTRGVRGALCKHQLALGLHKELSLPNLPAVTYKERHELSVLAIGDKAPPETFFMTDVELLGGTGQQQEHNNQSFVPPGAPVITDTPEAEPDADDNRGNDALEVREALMAEFSRASALLTQSSSENTLKIMQKFTNALKAVETAEQLTAFAIDHTTSRLGRKIRVQPTSTARRRHGVSRTTSRLPAGRPVGVTKRRQKIKRSLWLSISQNRPNAKSHGTGH